MSRKPTKKERAAKKLAELLGEHLSKLTPAQQDAMHEKFERHRLSNHRDSGAKKPSPLRAEIR